MDRSGCREHLGIDLGDAELKAMEAMDDPDQLMALDALGRTAGAVLVEPDHFGAGFDARVAA